MRKGIVVLGLISVVVGLSVLSGSGLPILGTLTGTSAPQATVDSATSTPEQSAAAMTPATTPTSDSTTPIAASQIVTTNGPLVLLNPSRARPGSTVGVTGSGYDPGTTIDVYLKHTQTDAGRNLGFVQADKGGGFGGFTLTMPPDFASGQFIVLATQHNGKKQAFAMGTVAANSPVATFGTTVGKVGDVVTYSLKGFAPAETVTIYFNSLASAPITTVTTDSGGEVRQQHMKVPYGAIGNNSFIFVGKTSQSPVTVSFTLLNLYPSITPNLYGAKPDTTLAFTGKGFGPNERVFIHVNSIQSPPVGVAVADATGSFKNGGQFTVPFTLKGKTNFIAVGEQSQAPVSISIDVLPYSPSAETSTYGGRPGTTVTFYGTGFARGEVIHVYVGRGARGGGQEVSCFSASPKGDFGGAGNYDIQFGTPAGNLVFSLVGDKSKAAALAKMQVMPASAGVPAPPAVKAAPFHCPLPASSTMPLLPTPTVIPAPPPAPAGGGNGGGDNGGGNNNGGNGG